MKAKNNMKRGKRPADTGDESWDAPVDREMQEIRTAGLARRFIPLPTCWEEPLNEDQLASPLGIPRHSPLPHRTLSFPKAPVFVEPLGQYASLVRLLPQAFPFQPNGQRTEVKELATLEFRADNTWYIRSR